MLTNCCAIISTWFASRGVAFGVSSIHLLCQCVVVSRWLPSCSHPFGCVMGGSLWSDLEKVHEVPNISCQQTHSRRGVFFFSHQNRSEAVSVVCVMKVSTSKNKRSGNENHCHERNNGHVKQKEGVSALQPHDDRVVRTQANTRQHGNMRVWNILSETPASQGVQTGPWWVLFTPCGCSGACAWNK